MWPWRHETDRGEACRRRKAGRRRPLQVEWLEPRQVMAVSVLSPLPDLFLASNSPNQSIGLSGLYDDTAVGGTVVRFDSNLPGPNNRVFVELFDQAAPGRTRTTPVTAANFLRYVDGGEFNTTFIHRSVPGFIVQGGGFKVTGTSSFSIANTTSFGTIVNEPGAVGSTNVRGTIAMAKLGGDPNSASNQWFFNLADNTANLDNQNGGFTTFGRVLGDGMNTVDAIAAVPRFRYNSPYDTLPLQNVSNPVLANDTPSDPTIHLAADANTLNAGQFVSFPTITRVGELVYSVTTDSPSLVTPTIDGSNNLRLAFAPGGTGTATVSVTVASVFNPADKVVDSFIVTRRPVVQPDAIGGTTGGSLYVAESSGTAFTTRKVSDLPAGSFVEQVCGDFNNDGRTDTASRAADGTWWVTLTPASGTAAATAWTSWSPAIAWANVAAIDVNADGRSDLVGRDPSSGAWWAAVSNGSAFTTGYFGSWSTAVTWTNVTFGDFDGDGRGDVAGRDAVGGGWWVSRGTATGFSTSSFGSWSTAADWQTVVAGDFNGDGRTDLAGRQKTGGTWWVATSNGTRFTTTKFGGWTTTTTWSSILVGDFDGDGKSDIAGRDGGNGNWWISRSTGTAFTTARAGSWATTISWQSILVGDFTGDGRSDIAGRDPSTGAWWVARSGGTGGATTFTNSRFGAWSKASPWTNIAAVLT